MGKGRVKSGDQVGKKRHPLHPGQAGLRKELDHSISRQVPGAPYLPGAVLGAADTALSRKTLLVLPGLTAQWQRGWRERPKINR